jgi:hypothetical protein
MKNAVDVLDTAMNGKTSTAQVTAQVANFGNFG